MATRSLDTGASLPFGASSQTKSRRATSCCVKLLGYDEERPGQAQLEALVYHLGTAKKAVDRIVAAVDAIHEALLDNIEGSDDFDLMTAANRQLTAGQKISIDEIPQLVELTSSAEVLGDEVYRLKMAYLRNRSDQVVRVLSDEGSPMAKADLAREINRLRKGEKPVEANNLINQVIGDQRLRSIGKSGWALTSWGNETRTIVEPIEECLHNSGEAMTEEEIYEFVSKLRPVAKASVPLTLMHHSNRFMRVTIHTWGLKAWCEKFAGQWWDSDEIKIIDARRLLNSLSPYLRDARVLRMSHPVSC